MEVKNSLVQKNKQEDNTFSGYLMKDMVRRKINETVGGENGQRFITSILSAVSINSQLQQCEFGSIVSAAFLGEALKLSPSPQLGHYFMVPFNVKTGQKDQYGQDIYIKIAQFQLGYKGYIQLAIRSGQYRDIGVFEIRQGEYLGRDKLTGKYKFEFIEDDDKRESLPVIGYMAYFEYLNGFTKTLYWSKEKMLNHADTYSQAFSKEATTGKYPKVSFADFEAGKVEEKDMWKYSSFWYKDFDGMALKTMLRQLISKWGIMSIEMQEAYTKDMATINENGTYEYVDTLEIGNEHGENVTTDEIENIPEETEPVEVKEEKKSTRRRKPKEEKVEQAPEQKATVEAELQNNNVEEKSKKEPEEDFNFWS